VVHNCCRGFERKIAGFFFSPKRGGGGLHAKVGGLWVSPHAQTRQKPTTQHSGGKTESKKKHLGGRKKIQPLFKRGAFRAHWGMDTWVFPPSRGARGEKARGDFGGVGGGGGGRFPNTGGGGMRGGGGPPPGVLFFLWVGIMGQTPGGG